MARFFFFLVGFGLSLIGFMYIIIYLNLLTMGYNLSEYVNFIIRRIECWNSIIGIIIIVITLIKPKGDNDELHIRYFS
ncbi:MAG: hypothetical protein SOT41_05720 [Candidatus Faecisoma sp.]|jgi:ABC-type multidrug transport system permease subunit|nr:hypothetical protein [Acholeplasma sp.]MCI5677574.1 hypothetical protein [Acholeplasma sp.]MDY2893249.1 hypothetical protein [Candidatus Faecisoma sp.]CCY27622.1 putative uncharacterized protein [Acholeplasma sp. CAG:878]